MRTNVLYELNANACARMLACESEYCSYPGREFYAYVAGSNYTFELSSNEVGVRVFKVQLWRERGVCVASELAYANRGSFDDDIRASVVRALRCAAYSIECGFDAYANLVLCACNEFLTLKDSDWCEMQEEPISNEWVSFKLDISNRIY